jgi:PTS system nitrogen regulatory IIA component
LLRTYPEFVKPSSLQAVLNREAEMSTFLNEGLAVPHAAVAGIDNVYWAIGIPKHGISDVETGAPIQAVVLALYPFDQSGEYLGGLANAAGLFRNSKSVEQLTLVDTPEDILNWLAANDFRKVKSG